MECYLLLKIHGLSVHEKIVRKLRCILLKEKKPTEKDNMLHHYDILEKANLWAQLKYQWLPAARESREG